MKVKKYVGNTTQEVMNKIKTELGSNAVILHTKKIRKPSFFGLFHKDLIEIVAAVDEKNKIKSKVKQNNINNKLNNGIKNNTEQSISEEMKELKSSINYIVEKLKNKDSNNNLEELEEFLKILKDNGVREEIAVEILGEINSRLNLQDKDHKTISEIIKHNIKSYLGEPSPIKFDGEKKVIFFIGPTGVGKTTTLAKIAANFTLNEGCEVGFITADTYRIGAVDQLKIYAEILEIPVNTIYEIKGIYEALSNLRDKDIILIDTAGRSHKNKEQMAELKDLINTVKNKEVYLILNLGTDISTITSILKQYEFIQDYKIIFTKVDECENVGNILNTKYYSNKQLSYITTGQNVPDDIEVVDIEKITKLLVGEIKYES
ncbi:flagellar biosynthesis protein FlhF [Gottschalkia purinilytica]|uniref:Flagellar biosynthesis protein FlhF n=1 Tax=Gottschalkia purinilytica TaxID=1503 RepID=A0A0L0WBF8_GOTPU|nr:flagellar biosynthesis protein FlhF [Gottschalkia purinilytica]KNF08833.1 flagellar biosynthesis protein FlhF [Gottschalkia purinilytica]